MRTPVEGGATSGRVIREHVVVKTCRSCNSSATWAVAALLCVWVGCASRKTAPTGASAAPAVEKTYADPTRSVSAPGGTGTIEDSKNGGGAIPRFGITSPCVLHAGDSQAERRERITPSRHPEMVVTTGTCSFNAECIREQGRDFEGDGDVELDCHDRSCSCSLRRWSPSNKTMSFSFQIDEICSTADMAERLIRDHCMVGLKVNGMEGATSGRRDQ